ALTAKQQLFVKEYLVDLNATQAAIRAGYSAKTAEQQASRLLSNVKVQDAIQKAMSKRSEKVEIKAERVLQRWIDIAFADPNEIIHFRRVCCRHCFGINHEYQWIDEKEYETTIAMLQADAAEKEKPAQLPSDIGGYGFDPLLRPHPKCPVCHGEGHGQLHVNDTRDLSPQAKALYAGAKSTAAGLEIKMHDQDRALENIARHLGMLKDNVKLEVVKKLEDFM
ncbi:phage terminase small subunit, partial [Fontibacillus solani]